MGLHVGDNPSIVQNNRAQLLSYCGLDNAQWLNQVHGIACVESGELTDVTADACWTDKKDLACIVMTADCLPVAFRQAGKVAAAHAGWRGLLNGVLESTLVNFDALQVDIWLGPAIGQQAFEVGPEVREQFITKHSQAVEAFLPSANAGKWLADIYKLARITLRAAGVNPTRIFGGEYCTYSDEQHFYSYRRTPKTGRLATVVYRTKGNDRV
jgi:YfiH family protein